ncbi:hypothetical protein [Pontibacter virosus]|uniref:Winged helix DNA-binding protein n=1 Tax=Pontibacter virosus TaxID=1765052 RepID=A0A2U1AVF4_9BACT|nr:hypothetical protein [Pontibacter virosus]PVY40382.1 hypothetical protein C8E01_10711 [Pontibacter virosus]
MFITEKELVVTLKQNYSEICTWNTESEITKLLEEVNLGFGVADIVISKLRASYNSLNEVELNYFDLTIYKIVESSKGVTLDEIKKITRASNQSIKASLEKLILESYINKEDTFYNIKNVYQHQIEETVAIEAKLKNWKRALQQAYRYKWFASLSYVVLDSKNINPAKRNIQEFEKYNVGLATIAKNGSLDVIFKPYSEAPLDIKMQLLLNELLKRSDLAYLERKKDFHIPK